MRNSRWETGARSEPGNRMHENQPTPSQNFGLEWAALPSLFIRWLFDNRC